MVDVKSAGENALLDVGDVCAKGHVQRLIVVLVAGREIAVLEEASTVVERPGRRLRTEHSEEAMACRPAVISGKAVMIETGRRWKGGGGETWW